MLGKHKVYNYYRCSYDGILDTSQGVYNNPSKQIGGDDYSFPVEVQMHYNNTRTNYDLYFMYCKNMRVMVCI